MGRKRLTTPDEEKKAFDLYYQGESIAGIAKEIKRNPTTVTRMRDRGNWEKRKKAVKERALAKADKNLVDWTVDTLEMLEGARSKLYKQMMEGDVPIKSLEGAVTSLGHNTRTQSDLRGVTQQSTNIVLVFPNVRVPTEEAIQLAAGQDILSLPIPKEKTN